MIRQPILRRWYWILGTVSILSLAGLYTWSSHIEHDKNPDKDLELYRVFKLELDVTQFSYQVRKSILTHQLQALEENKEQVCLSDYYNQQQILDYKLALLDEENVSVCFHLKKKLENYGRKCLAG